jgi:hypothetical protein
MKNILTLFLIAVIIASFANVSAYAQRGGGNGVGRSKGVGGGNSVGAPNGVPRGPDRAPSMDRGRGPAVDQRQIERDRERERANDVFNGIERNSTLSKRVQAMIPAGTTLKEASAGFKNQGQFIAALHASRNLDIPFWQLKTAMTGSRQLSLGQAIHELRPNLNENDANAEAKRAERDAKTTERGLRDR